MEPTDISNVVLHAKYRIQITLYFVITLVYKHTHYNCIRCLDSSVLPSLHMPLKLTACNELGYCSWIEHHMIFWSLIKKNKLLQGQPQFLSFHLYTKNGHPTTRQSPWLYLYCGVHIWPLCDITSQFKPASIQYTPMEMHGHIIAGVH